MNVMRLEAAGPISSVRSVERVYRWIFSKGIPSTWAAICASIESLPSPGSAMAA